MHGPQRDTFLHRRYIVIDEEKCVKCQRCVQVCPLKTVLKMSEQTGKAQVANVYRCAGCFKCVERCPSKAIRSFELSP